MSQDQLLLQEQCRCPDTILCQKAGLLLHMPLVQEKKVLRAQTLCEGSSCTCVRINRCCRSSAGVLTPSCVKRQGCCCTCPWSRRKTACVLRPCVRAPPAHVLRSCTVAEATQKPQPHHAPKGREGAAHEPGYSGPVRGLLLQALSDIIPCFGKPRAAAWQLDMMQCRKMGLGMLQPWRRG